METVTSGCSGDVSIRLNSQGERYRELNHFERLRCKLRMDRLHIKKVLGTGKIEPEDLSSLPRVHVKSHKWWHTFLFPVLGRQTQVDPGGSLAGKPSCVVEPQDSVRDLVLQNKVDGS